MIAPDIALTAAHCGNQRNNVLYISAYRSRSTNNGAQTRTCAEWIKHPNYEEIKGLINDVALCKLDSEVTIDEAEVRLELNREDTDTFPIVGEELVAMGFGLLGTGEGSPTKIHRTTLEGRECGSNRPETQVCAGGADGADGVTDVCRGDSGGPLVKVVPQSDGPDIHYHVGLVSSGALCPAALTGTYARTSKMMPWIDYAMCELGSVAAVNCENEPVECGADESELVVSVLTDNYPTENQWVLEKLDANEEVKRHYLQSANTLYEDTLCLEPDSTYRWTLTDTHGDGLCYQGVCGSFSVTLDGEEILENGSFTDDVSVTISTSSETGDPQSNSPSISPSISPSAALSDSTTISDCDDDVLNVTVKTDFWAYENDWLLEVQDQSTQEWSLVKSNDLPDSYTWYEDIICLKSGRNYRWTLNDSYGDGLCIPEDDRCGYYSVALNGVEIVENAVFEDVVVHEFGVDVPTSSPTSSPSSTPTQSCSNMEESWVGNGGKTKSCYDIAKLERKRRRKCTDIYKENCPGLCKKRCKCHDYEYEFKAKKTSNNWVTCDTLEEDKCRFATVKKNCPTLCNDDCAE